MRRLLVKHLDDSLYTEKHNPTRMLEIGRRVLAGSTIPEVQKMVARMNHCSARRRCHAPHCPNCGVSEPSMRRLETAGKVPIGSTSPDPSHSIQSRARKTVRDQFGHLPEENIGCITIHLGVVGNALDAEALIDHCRKQLRYFLRSKLPDAKVWMSIEAPPRRVKDTYLDIYSDTRWKQEFQPDDIVWLVHGHGLIYCPDMSPSAMKSAFMTRKDGKRSRYSGSLQVDVKSVEHNVLENGKDIWGIEGFAGYAVKTHFEPVEYAQNGTMYVDWVALTSRLTSKNKHRFRFNINKYNNDRSTDQTTNSISDNDPSKQVANDCYFTNSDFITLWSVCRKLVDASRPVRILKNSRGLLDQPSNRGPPTFN